MDIEKEKNVPEIVIPKGYEIDELLDIDNNGYTDESPLYIEEVKIKVE